MTRRGRSAALATIAALTVGPMVALPGAAMPNEAGRKILDSTGITLEQIRSMGDEPLVVELGVRDASRQAAFVGLIQVDRDPAPLFSAPPERAAPPLFPPGPYGTFPTSNEAEGLPRVQLAPDDYTVLDECRPARCRVKLDAEAIEVAQQLDWERAQTADRFLDWFRRALHDDVSRYRDRGLDGLITYADKPEPFPVARGVTQLQQDTAPLLDLYPDIHAYLIGYPSARPERVSDRLVWSLADFGFRPTLSVDHLVVGESGRAEGLRSAVVHRTIYASHYLAGRLQLASVIDGQAVFGVPGHFVLAVDQILFDDEVGRMKRILLSRGLRSKVTERLATLRERADTDI